MANTCDCARIKCKDPHFISLGTLFNRVPGPIAFPRLTYPVAAEDLQAFEVGQIADLHWNTAADLVAVQVPAGEESGGSMRGRDGMGERLEAIRIKLQTDDET